MSEPAEQRPPTDASEAEIDAVIAEFGDDARQAIRALLHDLTEIARDAEAAVSRGFVRGRLLAFHLHADDPREKLS